MDPRLINVVHIAIFSIFSIFIMIFWPNIVEACEKSSTSIFSNIILDIINNYTMCMNMFQNILGPKIKIICSIFG